MTTDQALPAPGGAASGDSSAGNDGRASGHPGTKVPEPVYTAVEGWVTGYFLPMFRRTLGGEYRWCAQWWEHGEAISRLTSLWHAWEVLRLQPGTGIGVWYRDYLDHQLPILMGARGPFYQCSEAAHREPREAATTPAPSEWWDLTGADDLPDPLPGAGNDGPGDALGAGHAGA